MLDLLGQSSITYPSPHKICYGNNQDFLEFLFFNKLHSIPMRITGNK